MRSTISLLLALIALATGAQADSITLTRSDREQLIETVAGLLETQYVFPDRGVRVAQVLRARLTTGDYHALSAAALAERLTRDLQDVTGDAHLRVEYSATPLPDDDAAADAGYDSAEAERYYGAHLNFGFERLERLADNIGLLDLRVFAPVAMGGETAVAAMRVLGQTNALIIDLRRNGGGDGEMGMLLASYLFDSGRKPLSGFYSRPRNETTHQTTQPYVPGPRYGESKPVYVLTSKRTFSAAEAFAYDLKSLGRATIVGEASGGGAHPFEYKKVHRHFVLWLVTGRSVNPITGTNWQTVGVQPDVVVPADEALDEALALARQALTTKRDASAGPQL